MSSPVLCTYSGLGSLIPLIGFCFSQPKYVENENGEIECHNSLLRQSLFSSFIGLSAIGFSPFLMTMSASCPGVLPASVLITTAICAGSSLYSYYRPSGSLLYL